MLRPALVGYRWKGRVQLLSGSHRWAAAVLAQLPVIPVVVLPLERVEAAWGTEAWAEVMRVGNGALVEREGKTLSEGVVP